MMDYSAGKLRYFRGITSYLIVTLFANCPPHQRSVRPVCRGGYQPAIGHHPHLHQPGNFLIVDCRTMSFGFKSRLLEVVSPPLLIISIKNLAAVLPISNAGWSMVLMEG